MKSLTRFIGTKLRVHEECGGRTVIMEVPGLQLHAHQPYSNLPQRGRACGPAQSDSAGKWKLGKGIRPTRIDDSTGLRPPTRWTMATSISTATDRCNISTDRRSLHQFFLRSRIPSNPRSGPAVTLTRSPHLRYGCGSALRGLSITLRMASISGLEMFAGCPPNPTTVCTPGVVRTGSHWVRGPRRNT